MPSELRSSRLAVLVDADNASAKIADDLFEEIAKIGGEQNLCVRKAGRCWPSSPVVRRPAATPICPDHHS